MIKETKKEVVKVERNFYCDICNKKIKLDYLKDSISCLICKRHLCQKHKIYDNEDYSDYPGVYCVDCHKIIKKYDEELSIVEKEYDDKREQIIVKRDKECLDNIKNLK